MLSSQNYGSPVFWTSNERPEPRLLNLSGAFKPHSLPTDSGEEPFFTANTAFAGVCRNARKILDLPRSNRNHGNTLVDHQSGVIL
jgi:hypothetical protein